MTKIGSINWIYKFLIVVTTITILILVFRNILFEYAVKYETISIQNSIVLQESYLKDQLDTVLDDKDQINLNELITECLMLTSTYLDFSATSENFNPNKINSRTNTHCVGFATVFNSLFNNAVKKYANLKNYKSYHCRGSVIFLGINLNNLKRGNLFWKDHDFNEIRDLMGVKCYWLDAALYDKFRLHQVRYKSIDQ